MKKSLRILYAGDSDAGGAARYLLAILRALRIRTTHLPPDQQLSPKMLSRPYAAVILSDFPRRNAPDASQRQILRQVQNGTGLLMVGGWASFSGPFGGWKGSVIEKILPVTCAGSDDRLNFPGGAYPALSRPCKIFQSLSFINPPAIVGANRIRAKRGADVLLELHKITGTGNRLRMESAAHPLLVIDPDPSRRVASYASDFAPHWCGGLVDWGPRILRLPAGPRAGYVEIGSNYVRFVSSIIRWLTELAR
jgi:uncharacterized membrane protein